MLDKIKNLTKQTMVYGTSTIIGRFLNFLLVPFYTNVFIPADYGIFTVVFAYIAFFTIFFSLGLDQGYFKFASTLELGDRKQNFSHSFLTILFNSLLISLIIFLLANSLSGFVGSGKDYTTIVRYSALILLFDALSLVPFAYLRLNNKPGIFAAIRIINIVINVALNLILVLIFKMGIEAVFLSNVIASIVTFILLLPYIIRNLSFTYSSALMKELLNFSLPYVPASLASIMVQVLSRPIMLLLTDEATVGIFQANFRLGIVMMLIVSMFDYAWRPFFLNHANEPDAKRIFSKVLTIFIGATSLIFIVMTFLIEDFIRIPIPPRGHIIGSKYWEGVYIVPMILFSYQLYGIYFNFMPGIYIEKKTRYLPFITGLAAIINIAGNFLLIPVWGLWGAAIATFLSYVSMTIYMYLISNKFYPVQYEWSKVLSMLGINIMAMLIYYISVFSGYGLNIFIKLLLIIVLAGVILYLMGMRKLIDTLQLIKAGK